MTTDCYQLGLLSLMIKNNKVPKNILLSVWPVNYVSAKPNTKQSEDILFLKYYYTQSDFIRNQVNNISPLERYKYFFDSYRFNGMVTNTIKYYYLTSKKNEDGKYSFAYQKSFATDSLYTANSPEYRSKAFKGEPPLILDSNKTKYLLQFIDTCKKYNINLMCYYLSQYKEDLNRINKGVEFAEQTLKEKNIPFIEFTQDNAAEILNTPGYWTDGEHLNEKGGRLQSSILNTFTKQYIKQ